jgi:Ca2+-binding RTX toxin-like protein
VPFYDTIIKISTPEAGGRPDDHTLNHGMNADGSTVFVQSFATNLAPNDPNGTTLSSLSYNVADGTFQYLGPEASVFMSPDAGHYTFGSNNSDLVPNTPAGQHVYVTNTATGDIVRANIIGTDGLKVNSSVSVTTVANGGDVIGFWSRATNLVDGFTSTSTEAYVHTISTGVTELVSPGLAGSEPDRSTNGPKLSGDGRIVVYTSSASNLVAGDTNGVNDVFMFDRGTNQVTRISTGQGGVQTDGSSAMAAISADGSKIAFTSSATNLVSEDTNGLSDMFVYDVETGAVRRVGEGLNGAEPDGAATLANFSADGRYITFTSASTNITAEASFAERTYVTDLATSETSVVDLTHTGAAPNRDSGNSSLSGDGRYITYTSMATNLIEDSVRDFYWDVFRVENPLYQQSNTAPTTSFGNGPDPVSNGEFFYLDFSNKFTDADGDDLTFEISALPNGLRLNSDLGVISGTVDYTGPVQNLPVQITARDGRGGSVSVDFEWQVSERKAPDSFLREFIARDTAYRVGDNISAGRLGIGDKVFDPEGNDTGYFVNRIWDIKSFTNDQQGFIAVGLVGVGLQPVIGVRGSFSGLDLAFADTDPRGVGVTQFETAWNATGPASIRDWVETREALGINIVGHSLGGAQSQLLAAYASQAGNRIASVTTYNSPGIPIAIANLFNDALVGPVNHRVSSGDIVSMAGNAFIPGIATLYDLTTYDPDSTTSILDLITLNTGAYLSPLLFLLGAHVDQWSQPGMYITDYNGATTLRDGEPVILGEFAASELGSPDYTHLSNVANTLDNEYLAFLLSLTLAGNAVGSFNNQPNFGGELAASLLRREDADATRVEIGQMIREFEALTNGSTNFSDAIINVLTDQAGAIAQALTSASLAPARLLTDALLQFDAYLWSKIANLGSGFWGAMENFSQSLVTQILNAPAQFWDRVTPFDTEAWKTFSTWTAQQWAETEGWSDAFWDQIVTWNDSLWTELRAAPFDSLSRLANLSLDSLRAIGEFGSAMLNQIFTVGSEISDAAISALSGLPSFITGTAADDTTTGTDARETFDGGMGNDTITPQGGFDDIRLGAGNDVVRGTADDLNGDRIADFTDGDSIHLLDLLLDLTDLNITLGSAYLDIDTNEDGQADTHIKLLGEFQGDDFAVTQSGANTIITTSGAANGFSQNGTSLADLIVGSNGNDNIDGLGGNDTLRGLGGRDTLVGDAGNDQLEGGTQNDAIFGGDGQDTLYLGFGNDFAGGGAGDDAIYGGAGLNTIYTGLGNDTVNGGFNGDAIIGGSGHNQLFGNAGNDTITAGAGGDFVGGGEGNDLIKGTSGLNTIYSGLGNDTVNGGADADAIIGGGSGTNQLFGNGGDDTITAGAGGDLIGGGASDDLIFGGAGNDTVYAGLGNDQIGTGQGNDLIYGSAGSNQLYTGLGNDTVQGGTGADAIFGAGGSNTLLGNADNDVINGGDAGDFLAGGTGNDTVLGGAGNDTTYLGAGNDFTGGGAGNDVITAGAGTNRIYAGVGDDTVIAGTGRDVITGGPGIDHFIFATAAQAGIGAARDVITDFAPGVDKIDLSALNLTFIGGGGFSNAAGELRYIPGFAVGDINGDGLNDFAIELLGAPALTSGDFIL